VEAVPGAQDKFFAARSEVFAAKETELREHAEAKEQLLVEAQALLPVTDWRVGPVRAARHPGALGAGGPVPRESRDQLEQGLRKVEDAVKRAEDTQWKRSNPEALARAEATVSQLRTAIDLPRGPAGQGPGPGTTPRPRSATPRRPSTPGVPGWSRPSAPWRSSPADAGRGFALAPVLDQGDRGGDCPQDARGVSAGDGGAVGQGKRDGPERCRLRRVGDLVHGVYRRAGVLQGG
jgi:hypothetical protein